MPNGHRQRQKHEEALIRAIEEEGWHYFEDAPKWVISSAKSDKIDAGAGFKARRKKYHGDNYVYLAVSSVHGRRVHVFSQRKSEYYETTTEEGYCPNCESYVKRYDEDEYLTCHRCGWQYKPLAERLKNIF